MHRRLRLGPPKQMLPHTSGRRIRPISLPAGDHIVTPLYPTLRPALLEAQTLPLTSQRTPSGPHLTPSTMKSENRLPFESLLSVPTSNTNMSPLPPGPVSPGPLPVEATYSFLKSGENASPLGSGT